MLDAITGALQNLGVSGTFASRHTTAPDDLRLRVAGVGEIGLPVSWDQARALCDIARPARFGVREHTVLDKRVRDTWEVARSRVKIDKRAFKRTLAPELELIRDNLGLAANSQLEARLDKLLVYGPGQSFAPHQDTERSDDMIGTLVVVLPSVYRGGTEIIEHRGERVTYRRTTGSGRLLTFIAFYADCHHEVRAVAEGFRVVMVFNLLMAAGRNNNASSNPEPDARAVKDLAASIAAHFEPPNVRAAGKPAERPEKLGYLLDHDYTRSSLAWGRLKGPDAPRAEALRAAAETLGFDVFLALADIHEIWSCEHDDHGWGRSDYGDADEWEDDGDGGFIVTRHEQVSVDDLIDSDVELRRMIDASGKQAGFEPSRIWSEELCYTKPNAAMEPFQSEYEPYMGNDGDTLERWYHRGAVLLWPRANTFVIRAQADPIWALDRLGQLIGDGALDEARALAHRLLPVWPQLAWRNKTPAVFVKTLKLAATLQDAELATNLLSPFDLEPFGPNCNARFVALLQQYGTGWARAVVGSWESRQRYLRHETRLRWYQGLPALCGRLCEGPGKAGRAFAGHLVDHELELATQAWTKALADPHAKSAALDAVAGWLVYVLEGADRVSAEDTQRHVIELLKADSRDVVTTALVAALRVYCKRMTVAAVRALGLDRLQTHLHKRVGAALAASERAPDDWRIDPPVACTCELCVTLCKFLSGKERHLEWPLAKDKRAHVHRQIEAYSLPVSHATQRVGRPYKLTLSKLQALFDIDDTRRQRLAADLAWLEANR